jgi:hypothetical protein
MTKSADVTLFFAELDVDQNGRRRQFCGLIPQLTSKNLCRKVAETQSTHLARAYAASLR